MKNHADTTFPKWSKSTTPVMDQLSIPCLLIMMYPGRTQHHSGYMPAQLPNRHRRVRGYQKNSLCRCSLCSNWPVPKYIKIMKGTWQVIVFRIFLPYEQNHQDNWQNLNWVCIVLYGDFQICNRMPLLLKLHARVLRNMGYHNGNLFSNGSKKGEKCGVLSKGCIEKKRAWWREEGRGRKNYKANMVKMFIFLESGGRVYRISLHYSCNFSVSLKLCHQKK